MILLTFVPQGGWVRKSMDHTQLMEYSQSTDGSFGTTNHPPSDVNLHSGEMKWNNSGQRQWTVDDDDGEAM